MSQDEGLTFEEAVLAGLSDTFGTAYKKMDERVNRLIANNIGSHPYRKHFLERLTSMGQSVVDGLLAGKLQLSDAYYYASRGATTDSGIKVFLQDDDKSKGWCNVAKSVLQADRPMSLSALHLAYHSGDTVLTKTNINLFTPKGFTPEIMAGEWKMRVDSKDIYEEMPIGRTFGPGIYPSTTSVPEVTQGTAAGLQAAYTLNPGFAYNANKPHGLYELMNPKVILGNKRIEFELDFAAALSDTKHTVQVALIGTTVRPN